MKNTAEQTRHCRGRSAIISADRSASTCSLCASRDAASFEAENGRYRVWCPACGHSTAWQPSLMLAELEWTGTQAEDEAEWQDF